MVPTGLRMDEKTWAPCHDRKSRQGDPGSVTSCLLMDKGWSYEVAFLDWKGQGAGLYSPECSQIWGRGDQVGPVLSVHPLRVLLSVSDWTLSAE